MWTSDDNHGAQVQFHSGRHMLDPREPTIGAWMTYGLGSMSHDLPRFVNMGPRYFDVRDGHYLGPAYDAVNLKVDPKNPLDFASPAIAIGTREQAEQFRLVDRLNRIAFEDHPGDAMLQARLRNYELAYRMQRAVPDLLRVEEESEVTRRLYGLD